MAIIICALCAIFNIGLAMNPANPDAWTNWISGGFCLGLMTAAIVIRVIK